MKLFKYLFLLTLTLLTWHCREPYDLNEIETNQKVLVVEGEITNKPGPYVIHLSQAIPFTNTEKVSIDTADVYVKDDLGNVYAFIGDGNGAYISDSSFIGLIGHTYTLYIKTPDGTEFRSTPCKIGPQSIIDKFYGFTERYLKYPKGENYGVDVYSNGFHAYADVSFLSGQKINTRLEAIISINATYFETYYITQPAYDIQLIYYGTELGRIIRVPLGHADTVGSYTLSWSTRFGSIEPSLPLLKTNSDYVEGSNLKKVPLCYAETTNGTVRFGNDAGYIYDGTMTLQLKAYTISDETYNYLYNVVKQLNGNNSFFEALPVQLRGNIICLSDTTKTVFGLFQANSVVEKFIKVTITQGGYIWEPTDGFPEDTYDSTSSILTFRKPDTLIIKQ